MPKRSRRGPYGRETTLQIQLSRYGVGLPGSSLPYADLNVACFAADLDPDGVLVFSLWISTIEE